MGKKKKSVTHDPLWAKAKQICRLNQADIAMAKELGLKPKSLMKNVPSPSQRWKKPVKEWIRELHEKRFGRRRPKPPSGPSSGSPTTVPMPHRNDDEEEDWISPEEDDQDEFQALAEAMLPQIEFFVPLQLDGDNPEWEQLRLGRRQKNLCWAACSLTVRLRDVPAVEKISLFGSVPMSVQRPFDQPWHGPEGIAVCHTLNLALWVVAADTATLCSLDLIVRQTLLSLLDVECIALSADRVEVLLIEAGTDRFLGRLVHSDSGSDAPVLTIPPEYVFRLEPLRAPLAIPLFDRTQKPPAPPPPSDGDDIDVPF